MLAEAEAEDAAQVLTRAFSGTPQQEPIAVVRDAIRRTMGYMAESPPAAVMFTRRDPAARSRAPAGGVQSPAETGGEGVVIGVASVFFCPALIFGPIGLFPGGEPDEKGFKSPPLGACYLSNMAVDPDFQRRGHARALLAAAVEEAQSQGFSVMSLHVDRGDPAATALYRSSGFVEDSDEQMGGFFAMLGELSGLDSQSSHMLMNLGLN